MSPQEIEELPLYERAGFDYAGALRNLLKKMTYTELAGKIGYSSTGSITAVLKGHVPSHVHGQAIWSLYLETFGEKPPMSDVQRNAQNTQ